MATRGWEGVTADQIPQRSAVKASKPSKFKNVRTEIDGITFDSKKEAARYSLLKLRQKAGEITDLRCHIVFALHSPVWRSPGGQVAGHAVVATYEADFVYLENGEQVVEDVKGMKGLPVYRLKRNHMAVEYGVTIREIR